MRHFILPLLLIGGAAAVAQTATPTDGPYKITRTSVLGGEGGWDYVISDPADHLLYIARATRVMVVDENTGKLVGEVAGINGAHGTAIVHKAGYGYATSDKDKSVKRFDLKTLKVLGSTPAAEDADGAIYDAPSNRVFTMNGDAASSTVLDASTGKLITNIPLGGKPEYVVSAGNGMIYANLEDKSEVVEIDAKAAKVTKRWATAPCKGPVSLDIDTAYHRLFSGCRSGVLAVSDYTTGKVVATVPIGKGVDSTSFDPATKDIFASNGDGTLTIIHQDSADGYHVLQTLATPVGSRNLGLDPVTHKVFVVSTQYGPAPAGGGRKPMLPGTFSLLTVEKGK